MASEKRDHSRRSAIIGSSRDARRAGTAAASTATNPIRSAVARSVGTSVGATPYRNERRTRGGEDPDEPDGQAREEDREPLAQDEAQHASAGRAERHAQPDLRSPLHHAEGDDAVDTHRRQQEGGGGEERENQHLESAVFQGARDHLLHGPHPRHGKERIGGPHGLLRGASRL